MPKLPRPVWATMTSREFSEFDTEHAIAVLPVAAIEQHGPHLPVSVDTTVINGIIARAIETLPDSLPVTFLPTQALGKSNEHTEYPGTLTLSADTLIRMWMEIGESVARTGIRKLLILNNHGGQTQAMEIVARDLRIKYKMLIVTANAWQIGIPEGLIDQHELIHGIHAGETETSQMLHLMPAHVHMEKAKNFISNSQQILQQFPLISLRFGWQTQDLNEQGACGNAANATAEKGMDLIEFAARKLNDLLQEIDRFPIDIIKDGPFSKQNSV